jgi:hypothetical protein
MGNAPAIQKHFAPDFIRLRQRSGSDVYSRREQLSHLDRAVYLLTTSLKSEEAEAEGTSKLRFQGLLLLSGQFCIDASGTAGIALVRAIGIAPRTWISSFQ